MSAPVIGITTYGTDERGRYTLPGEYVAAVERAGGVPLLLPPVPRHAERYLELVDGVILAGGGDIDPSHYQGRQHATLYGMHAGRDALELALARRIVETGTPLLAICRGMQALNVALGGTLVEHLPDEVGEAVLHRAPPREPVPHPIRIEQGSRLASVLGGAECTPLSWHHQAVRALAPALVAVAHAPDGTIEALELPEHPWLLAVQWHPELTAVNDPAQQRLFDALVAATTKKREMSCA